MRNRKNIGWHGIALAVGTGMVLVQGLRAEQRDTGTPANSGRVRATMSAAQPPLPRAASPMRPVVVAEAAPAIASPSQAIGPSADAARSAAPAYGAKPSTAALKESSASDLDGALDVTSAERLVIKVQGLPELSGDYRINDDQTISVPVIGRVTVALMEPADLERELAQRIARVVGREAYVTVEIAEYRPVFVSGYVSRPGAAPWKPGLTVLQAITIAGGDYRSGGSGGGSENVAFRIQRAVDDQKRIMAQMARLEAERAGAATIPVPDRLIARVGKKHAEELIGAQRTLFDSRKSANDAQIAGLERAIALTRQEMEGMVGQKKRLNEQSQFRREQFAKLKQLFDRGLLRSDRLHEEQLRLADIDERLASVGVSAARANSTLVGLERELADAKQKRRAEIDSELLKLERDSAQLDLEIKSFGAATEKSQFATAGNGGGESVIYEIVRQDRGGTRSIPAERYSMLKPGDMVVVSMK